MNIMSIKAELMSIYLSLLPAMENENTQNIIVIINFIVAVYKILDSKTNPFQNTVIPLASKIKSFLNRDNRSAIHFWHCPKKAN